MCVNKINLLLLSLSLSLHIAKIEHVFTYNIAFNAAVEVNYVTLPT